MAQQLFSILSLYNYDNTLFDGVSFPEELTKQDVIDNILLSCAELELLYPDLETMRRALVVWSKKSAYTWEKLAKTLSLEYNPIWNKDGEIIETRTASTKQNTDSTSTSGVTGFNTSSFQNADNINVNGSVNADSAESISRIEHGNIGVTTTQAMIREEREISYFNLIDEITSDFKRRFCVLVY